MNDYAFSLMIIGIAAAIDLENNFDRWEKP